MEFTRSTQTGFVPLFCTLLDIRLQKLIKINGDKKAGAKIEKL